MIPKHFKDTMDEIQNWLYLTCPIFYKEVKCYSKLKHPGYHVIMDRFMGGYKNNSITDNYDIELVDCRFGFEEEEGRISKKRVIIRISNKLYNIPWANNNLRFYLTTEIKKDSRLKK